VNEAYQNVPIFTEYSRTEFQKFAEISPTMPDPYFKVLYSR